MGMSMGISGERNLGVFSGLESFWPPQDWEGASIPRTGEGFHGQPGIPRPARNSTNPQVQPGQTRGRGSGIGSSSEEGREKRDKNKATRKSGPVRESLPPAC